MMRHIRYFQYLLRHKWFVLIEGLKLGVPIWILLLHDWDKFMPGEWRAYADYFFGGEKPSKDIPRGALAGMGIFLRSREEVKTAFDVAWNTHQKRNRHHWQWWLLVNDDRKQRFGEQSYDGGMTHSYIRTGDGKDVAIVWDETIPWWKPDWALVKEMLSDLSSCPTPLPMPDVWRREMLADWRGAGRALGKPDTRAWYLANREKMILHPETRAWVEQQLGLPETHVAKAHLRGRFVLDLDDPDYTPPTVD